MTGIGLATGAPPWTRNARWLVLVLLVLQAVLAWQFRTPAVATRHSDDAEYVILAGELLEGRYRDAFYRDAPAHARYPPGYPLVLAGLQVLGGHREMLYVAVNIGLAALCMLLLLDRSRRYLHGLTWPVFGLVLAVNPEWILVTGAVLSEPLFSLLIILGLYLEDSGRPVKSGIAATVAIALSSVVRSAGVAICAGVIVSRLAVRRWRAATILIVATAMTGGVWTVYTMRAPQAVERMTYAGDFMRTGMTDATGILRGVLEGLPGKVRSVTVDQVPTALGFPTMPGVWIDNLLGAVLLTVLLPVGLFQLWKRWPPAAFVLLAYGLLNLIWPWSLVRYIVPVAPLITLCLFLGIIAVTERWRPARTSGVVVALGAYLVAGATLRLTREAALWADCDPKDPYASVSCFPQAGDVAFSQAARFIGETLPADAVVFAGKEPSFYYLSGRRALNVPAMLQEDSATLAPALRANGAEWALTANAGPRRRQQGRLVATACRDFDLVQAFDSATVLLRLRPPAAAQEWGEACEATRIWRRVHGSDPDDADADRDR